MLACRLYVLITLGFLAYAPMAVAQTSSRSLKISGTFLFLNSNQKLRQLQGTGSILIRRNWIL